MMITEILTLVAYLVENCTGVTLIENICSTNLQDSFLIDELTNPLEDFTEFDSEDTIYQEYDPPQHVKEDPKSWKLGLPTFKKSFWECLKTVLLIQTVTAVLIGIVAVVIVFLDFYAVTWCYDETSNWYEMPKSVQHLRVIAQCVEGLFTQFWDFFLLRSIFPWSLIKKLNLLVLYVMAALSEVIYRLSFQMFSIYQVSWMSYPLNALFSCVVVISHFRLARHFKPQSLKSTVRIFFILTAQYLLGFLVVYFLVYKLFSFYVQQEEHIKVFVATLGPLMTAIPKVISRLGAQEKALKGIIHPGTAHVLVVMIYGMSAVVFRVMQAELRSIGSFVALGIAHAIIDLLERITITMRDHIWEYLCRLVRRQRSTQRKYRSLRSRRFIADLSIQIMIQETSSLLTALGFFSVYQSIYSESKPLMSYHIMVNFAIRASIGLSIDLFFNTFSLLIQTRVMNLAVNKVWKKKWRQHILVNCVVVWITLMYFGSHLFAVVRSKYESVQHRNNYRTYNCSLPAFL